MKQKQKTYKAIRLPETQLDLLLEGYPKRCMLGMHDSNCRVVGHFLCSVNGKIKALSIHTGVNKK